MLGLAAVAGGAGLATSRLLPEWSVGDVARLTWTWFQEHPWLYWWLGYGALATLVAQVALPFVLPGGTTRTGFWASRTAFVLLTVATVMLLRWPGLAHTEMNPDESQEIAVALALREDPRYWVSAEAGTHGPLVAFMLLPVRLLGMELEYGSARLVGLGLLLGCIFFLLATLRALFPEAVSRAFLTPLIICIAFLTDGFDLIGYNAEHPTLFLLCAGAYGCARLAAGPVHDVRGRALATGSVLGLVPFCKLQGVPVGLVLAGIALVCLLTRFRRQPRPLRAAALALCAGACIPAALVGLYLWAQGLLAHFWISYIRANLDYAAESGRGLYEKFWFYLEWTLGGPKWEGGPDVPYAELFLPYFLITVAAGLILLGLLSLAGLAGLPMRAARTRWPLLLAGSAVVLASAFSVIAPGMLLSHYLLFLPFPLAFLAAAVLATLHEHPVGWAGRLALVVACLATAVTLASTRALDEGNEWLTTEPEASDGVPEVIHQFALPGDRLVVWGWMDRYYVQAGMCPGTFHCNSAFILENAYSSHRDYFYRLYLRQFDDARPPVFVDAVGDGSFGYRDASKFAHECFPELRDRVASRYVLVAETRSARVYVAKDRLAKLPATQEIAIPVTPLAFHDMEWQGSTGRGSGDDSFVVLALPKPQWVTAVRITCAYEPSSWRARLRMFWKGTDQEDFTNERQVTLDVRGGPGEKTLTLPVRDAVAQIRIHPDTKPRVCTIQEIVLEAPYRSISEEDEYKLMAGKVLATAHSVLPGGATVLVASEGDDELLRLEGRQGWRFPQDRDGGYLSSRPEEGKAIAQVEALRAKGAQFVLFPKPAFSWLNDCEAFRSHLDRRYRRVYGDDCCVIYQLSNPRNPD
jgi:hypothetical protein